MSLTDHRMIQMPGTAIPDWAMVPAPDTGNPLMTFFLLLIQLLAVYAAGKGVLQIIKFYKPNAQNAPANLGKPVLMVIIGLFAIVPMRVYNLMIVSLTQLGWL